MILLRTQTFWRKKLWNYSPTERGYKRSFLRGVAAVTETGAIVSVITVFAGSSRWVVWYGRVSDFDGDYIT